MPRIHTCLRPADDDGLALPPNSCTCERRFRQVKKEAAAQFIGGDLGGAWKKQRDANGNVTENKNIVLLPVEKHWRPARTISQREIERAYAFARDNNKEKHRIAAYGDAVERVLINLGAEEIKGITPGNDVVEWTVKKEEYRHV